MADKRIQDLTPASSVGTSDRFVLEQSGQAKSLTGQILINDLAAALDGHGGISDISYTAPSSGSLTGTLTITLADNTVETFSVTNGKSIASIADKWAVSSSNSTAPTTWYDDPQTMTVTNRYEWHYQIITFNDGTSMNTDQAVVGVYGDTGDADHIYIKWSDAYPTQDADMLNYPSNYIGVCTTTADTAPTAYTDYEWFLYKGSTGDTGTGIVSVTLDSSSGLVDTYKVLFDDNTYTTFNVTNGSNIDSITKTSTSGLTDTYTVLLTNGDSTSFNVVNAKSISSITAVDVTHVAGHTDVYRINYNDGDSYSFSIYNGTNGSGSVSTVDEIPSNNQDVPLLLLGSGAPTTSTVGILKQRYFDQNNSVLYICTGVDTSGAETTYTWQGASVTVDSVLSSSSTNPVQNAVLTTLLGTSTLVTTAQTITEAINELAGAIIRPTGDTTDRKAEIEARLAAYGYCEFTDGVYYISAPITLTGYQTIRGNGKNCQIKKTTNSSTMGMFTVGTGAYQVTIRDLQFRGTNNGKPGSEVTTGEYAIYLNDNSAAALATIDNCDFNGLTRAGILCASGKNNIRSINVTNCRFSYCNKGIEFAENGEFANVTNCNFISNYCGVSVIGGNNKFAVCGFDANTIGFRLTEVSGASTNDGHGSAVSCTFNHNTSYAIYAENIDNGYIFDACNMHYGDISITNSKGIVFSNCIILGHKSSSNHTDIIVSSCPGVVIVTDCEFLWVPVFTVTSSNYFIKRNCKTVSGTNVAYPAELGANVLYNASTPVAASYSSTGKTFTLTDTRFVRITHNYTNAKPVSIGCKQSENNTGMSYLFSTIGNESNVSTFTTFGILSAGTYYIWASAASAANNTIVVTEYPII